MISKSIFFVACVGLSTLMVSSCKDEVDDDFYQPTAETAKSETDELSASAIREFLAFAKVPRYGFHLEKANAYLMDWAGKNGYVAHTDAALNVWFDVPATPGMENKPKVIFQAHMDQICASAPGETYDYTRVVGEPYYEGDLLKGRKVNLGADDGSGVGMILALVASDIPHGPIRALFTTNEDYNMEGASTISPSVLDAEYLINIDNEWLGDIAIGCYGGITDEFAQHYQTMGPTAGLKKITFKVDGLLGGHSGVDIGSGHLSASAVLGNIAKEVILPANGKIINLNCGTYANAIPSLLTLSFAVEESNCAAVKTQLEKMVEEYKRSFPIENGIWLVEVSDLATNDKLHEEQVVSDLVNLFENVQQGVIEQDGTGRITKSNNIGVVTLTDGDFSFKVFPRSDFGSWLTAVERQYEETASLLGVSLNKLSSNPVWESDGKDELTQLMVKFHNEAGIKYNVTKAPGGLETAYFTQKKPGLKCVSVGPTIDRAHSIDEALHVSTVKPLMDVLVNVLYNLGDNSGMGFQATSYTITTSKKSTFSKNF